MNFNEETEFEAVSHGMIYIALFDMIYYINIPTSDTLFTFVENFQIKAEAKLPESKNNVPSFVINA